MKTKILFILIVNFLSACSGSVYTKRIGGLNAGDEIEGVIYYGHKQIAVDVTYDRIIHEKTKNITHHAYASKSSPKYCQPIQVTELKLVADYDNPMNIRYDPALFETSKFSVTLEKGMLSSVNTESTPGFKTAIDALQVVADIRDQVLFRDDADATESLEIDEDKGTKIACNSR